VFINKQIIAHIGEFGKRVPAIPGAKISPLDFLENS
jgi:hypothetical protein